MGKTAIGLTFKELNIEGYERVVEAKGRGLHAIIALHDTRLGPALGGIRAYPYSSFKEGLNDVLRLAKGMTYKAAVAETGTGGGKSIIFSGYTAPKPEEMLLAFAEAVNYFEGDYICAEDFGMHLADLATICQRTPYAVGVPTPKSCGDPSRFTAYGGFRGIEAVCKKLWGTDSVAGRTFAIQGLGSVGMRIASHLFWQGAHLIVADINHTLVEHAVAEFGARGVSPDEILSTSCDILVPCALGAILNPDTIPRLRCRAVAGLANNQLLSDQDGDTLFQRGILYAPDYVINSGGLLSVSVEIEPEGFNPKIARMHVDRIYTLLTTIFTLSDEKDHPTHRIAKEIAEHNLEQGVGKRILKPVFQTQFPALSQSFVV
jgi:leucine dehydrogenase